VKFICEISFKCLTPENGILFTQIECKSKQRYERTAKEQRKYSFPPPSEGHQTSLLRGKWNHERRKRDHLNVPRKSNICWGAPKRAPKDIKIVKRNCSTCLACSSRSHTINSWINTKEH